ncbi:MAG: transglycosylase SLT domain-containing protein [bacterium]
MFNKIKIIIIIFIFLVISIIFNKKNISIKNSKKIIMNKINTKKLKEMILINALKNEKWKNLEGISDKVFALNLIKICKKYKISPFLVFALIKQETNFRFQEVSNTGAQGLTQIEPLTAKIIEGQYSIYCNTLLNPYVNITIGILYLKYLTKQFGNLQQALSSYNCGATYIIDNNIHKTAYSENIIDYYKHLKSIYNMRQKN